MTAKRPSRWLYLIAAAILVAGWSVAVREAWRLAQVGAGLQLARAPGLSHFSLPAGDYKIYHEFAGVIDDAMYFHAMVPAGVVIAAAEDGGSSLTLNWVADPRPAYRLGVRRGVPVAAFTLPHSADVSIRIAMDPDLPDTYFAVGDERAEIVYGRFRRMMYLTLATTAAAMAAWLWIVLRRFQPPDEVSR